LPRHMAHDGEAWSSTLAEAPVLLEGVQADFAQGIFTLKSPAVNLVSASIEGDVWEEAIVGVTLTVAGKRLFHDTGARWNGLRLDGIGGDGLTESFTNEAFHYTQITN